MHWETVIGLEVHVQLATKSKIFSHASTAYGAAPNSQACLLSVAMPGTLPTPNQEAVNLAIRFALGTNAKVQPVSQFARKNYFYPDLPKGYQISQLDFPIVTGGEIWLNDKRIRITRAHLEEDAGKSIHNYFMNQSGIDLNRAGVPLLEVVSEPDLRSAKEASLYLRKLHTLVRALKISDGNMQEGSFRCDANVSVRPKGSEKLETRTEIKNINSFKFVEKAICFEAERQIAQLESGQSIRQETRLYDPNQDETRPMRSKEEAHDYRYFPDPDLPPIKIDLAIIDKIKEQMPELPHLREDRYLNELKLQPSVAEQIIQNNDCINLFETLCEHSSLPPPNIAKFILGDFTAALNHADTKMENQPIAVGHLTKLLNRLHEGVLSWRTAKETLHHLWTQQDDVDIIIATYNLKQMDDQDLLESIIESVLAKNPKQVEQFKAGNKKVIGFFVGAIMRETKGQANPKQVNKILNEKLST